MSDVSVPSVEEVAALLGKSVEQITAAYSAERADQANRCRVDPYTAPLAAALTRRVNRALHMANVPLGVSIDAAGATYIGANDPEVRRLEGPYRKTVLG